MNKKIVVAVLVVGASGVIKAWNSKPPQGVTPVIMGTYVFMLMLSLADMMGPDMSKLAGALAMLAMVYVLLEQDSFLWDLIKQQAGVKPHGVAIQIAPHTGGKA